MQAARFLSCRAPAACLPYFVTNGYKLHDTQLQSNGPMEKCTPQSIIAATIENGTPSCGRMRGEMFTEILAPYSESKEIDRVDRADILLSCSQGSRKSKLPTQGFPSVDCFVSLNGVDVNAPIKFVGVATFEGMNKGYLAGKDGVASCVMTGTETLINNGPFPIYAFDKVWVSEHPYMVKATKEEKSEWVPGIHENGHDPSQFRAATYPMRYTNVTTILQMIQHEMKAAYFNNIASESDAEQIIANTLATMMIPKEMPLFNYAHLYFAWLCYLDVFRHLEDWRINLMNNFLRKYWFAFREQNKNKYDVALDEGLDTTDEIYHAQTVQSIPFFNLDNPDLLFKDESFQSWHRILGEMLHFGMSAIQSLQHDFMMARYMGISLNAAEPTTPWDCSIRAGCC